MKNRIFIYLFTFIAGLAEKARFVLFRKKNFDSPFNFMGKDVLDSFPIGLAVVSGRKFIWTNKRLAEMLDVPSRKLQGVPVQNFYAELEDYERIGCKAYGELEESRSVTDDVFLKTSGEKAFPCRLTAFIPRSKKKDELSFWMAEDVSEARKVSEALIAEKERAEEAELSKSRFLANVSHEMRNPLNGVTGMVSLLEKTGLNSEQADYVSTIKLSAEKLLSIMNDILDFSKLEAGRIRIRKTEFDFLECLEGIIDILAFAAAENNTELMWRIGDDVRSTYSGDAARLGQVLMNLGGNAVKFTENGRVLIDVRAEPKGVRFSVMDTGIGIPEDKMDYIFERFSQAHSETSNKYGGTGLGLAISLRLVRMMGGTGIDVESEPGKGAVFSFSLPIEPVSESVWHSLDENPLGKIKILVISTSPGLTEQLEFIVAVSGAEREVCSSEEALSKKRFPYDFILMDDVCGMRNILKIRDLVRNGPEVSVAHFVLLARPGNMEIANSGIYDIFDSVIRKPLKFRQFMDGIRKARTGEPLSAVYPEDDSLTAEKYPMKILFAEDQKINREIVSAMMKLLGYSPDCVGSGTDVLKKIREKKYDMLFIDKSLPELDGLETARAVVCQYPEIRPRIVMITGDGSEEARLRAFSTGVDEYMLKPVAFENLKSMIESFGKKISDNSCPEIDTKYREIPYIDFKLIERHLVLGEDIVVELLKVFLNDTPERLRKISNLVFRGNYREIRDEAHALKGAAASIGASRLAEDCGMIQDACDEGKFTGLDKLSMKATETFKETNRFLENYKRFNL